MTGQFGVSSGRVPRRVALFVPCYLDQLRPEAVWATVEVLEGHGVEVVVPTQQTCCGQPLINSGGLEAAKHVASHFVARFREFDAVVAPSTSCVATVRHHYPELGVDDADEPVAGRVHSLCEFLVDVLGVDQYEGSFPHRVGVHLGCHGIRELRLGGGSERQVDSPSKVHRLLMGLRGIELVELERSDECCGFGGVFSVKESAVSIRMGQDRIRDHASAGAEILTSTDGSCLLHMQSLMSSEGPSIRIMHIAEVLAEAARGKTGATP
jgi:L-lactate dehydrogenase complex protein LldE